MSARRLLLLIVALVAARVLVVPLILIDPLTSRHNAVLTGDVRRYHRIAQSSGVPYRDFEVEYPPVTWAAIKVLDGGSNRAATILVVVSQLVCDLLVAAALAYGWNRRAALAYLVLGLPLVVYPFIYLRLDLLSVALAAWGLALVRRDRWRSGGVLLAVSCFAKLWPLAVLPMLALQRRWRALAVTVATGAAGLVAWVAVAGVDGVQQVMTFRGARGWQIESVIGALVRAFGHGIVHVESGAWRVGTSAATWSRPLGLAMVVVVAVVWWRAWYHRDDARVVESVAPLAALGAFLALAPILSPQYVCWLLPFAALAFVDDAPAMVWISAAVIALSSILLYVIKEVIWGEDIAMLLLVVRNGMVVALTVVGLAQIWRRPTRAVRQPVTPATTDAAPLAREPVGQTA
jgi:glycosyl transferase family 87